MRWWAMSGLAGGWLLGCSGVQLGGNGPGTSTSSGGSMSATGAASSSSGSGGSNACAGIPQLPANPGDPGPKEHPTTHHCYWLDRGAPPDETGRNWASALNGCSVVGGSKAHLATLGGADELSWVTAKGYFAGTNTWLGAQQVAGNWAWIDGEPWSNPPIAVTVGNCLEVRSDLKFYGSACEAIFWALCERDP